MTILTKMIDGISVQCSPEESAAIQSLWAMNQQYPQYSGAVAFDGVNPPTYDVPSLQRIFQDQINKAIAAAVAAINIQIETAQEDGTDTTALYTQRKAIKACASPDLSACKSPADLIAIVPAILQPYWQT